MDNVDQNVGWSGSEAQSSRLCPACGQANYDWLRSCVRCSAALPDAAGAIWAEIGHVLYLLHRLTDWQSRSLIPPAVGSRLKAETQERQRGLFAALAGGDRREAAAAETPVMQNAPPVVPPLPPQFAAAAAPAPRFDPADRAQAWAARSVGAPIVPPSPPIPAEPSGLRTFLQKYTIQTLFLLAAVLVLTSLRSLIAWDAVGAIAIRLIPLVPLTLTWMFWTFGQRTREENPWAAFTYHALAATLLSFDLVAVHRYWLGGLFLTAKPLFFLASALATGAACLLLQRERRLPYLHLYMTGLLTTLFAALQLARRVLLGSDDFRVLPLPLFGIAYLLAAALCFGMARLQGSKVEKTVGEPNAEEALKAQIEGLNRGSAWTLWGHLSVVAVLLLCALDIALQEQIGLSAYAQIALLAGALYGIAAQLLDEPRMVGVSGGLALLGGGLWLGEWGRLGEIGIGDMLLAVGAMGTVLAAFNARRTQGNAEALSAAWKRLAQAAVIGATVLVWWGMSARLIVYAGGAHASENLHGALLSLVCTSFLLGFARSERQPSFLYAALATGGAALLRSLLCLGVSPAGLSMACTLYGSMLCLLAARFEVVTKRAVDAELALSEWADPFRKSGFAVLLLGLSERCLAFLLGSDSARLSLTLLPLFAAFALFAAARRLPGRDTMRSLALTAMQITAALQVGVWCGLTQGEMHWTAAQLQQTGLALALLGWAWWGIGQALDRRENDLWGEGIANGGLTTAFSAGLVTLAAAMLSSASGSGAWEMWQGTLMAAFVLFALAAYRSRQETLLFALLALTGIAGVITAYHYADTGYAATTWTGFALIASGVTLLLARHLQSASSARLSWLPFFGGYALLEALQAAHPHSGMDRMSANACWIVGGLGMAFAWMRAARWSESGAFTYASALTLCGIYLRMMTWLWHPQPQWHALITLPFLIALYIAGTRFKPEEDALLGQPLRHTALAFSGLALLWSAGNGDGFLFARSGASEIVTLTLCAYGAAYAALAAYRRTPLTVGIGATTLTLAYWHHLFALSPLLQSASASAPLSWPHIAFLAIQAGLFWLTVGWIVRVRLEQPALANPLLILAGAVALFAAVLAALQGTEISGESLWTILTLACGGVVWYGLWIQEQGEACLHIGTWNLLAAWGWLLYSRIGWETSLLDLYLLPGGIYLAAIGHRVSRKRQEGASFFWWAGLLTLLTPAYLAFWHRSAGWHTALLIGECLAAVLWGLAQRIRAFVSAGLLFTMLFAAAVVIGHLPDHVGTVAALLAGVGLFIAGYYALTHREAVQRVMAAVERQWRLWQAWR